MESSHVSAGGSGVTTNSTSTPVTSIAGSLSNSIVTSTSITVLSNSNSSNNASTGGSTAKPHNSNTCVHIPPLLGVAPLGQVPLTYENDLQFKRSQMAFYHMPHPSDSERLRIHFPRQPCVTPTYYPQVSFQSIVDIVKFLNV